eukprot:894068_1
MATTNIPKQEYLHVLKTMNHCGQSNIIANYVEEANNYESNTALEDISEHDDVRGAKLHKIQNKVIQILNGILNDGAMPLDVAFCRLLIILPYTQLHLASAIEFMAFFIYFLVGSCFQSLRANINLKDICDKILNTDPSHQQCRLLRYLMESYFPNLVDSRCIKFKYNGNQATHGILSVLEQHIASTTEFGDPSIASIICDYVQLPNHEFVYFLNNFLWHFPLYNHWNLRVTSFIQFIHWRDKAGQYHNPGETTKGHLLSRVLIDRRLIRHNDEGLKFEAHRMALMKLNTADGISWYFRQRISASIQCYVNPKLFVELVESAVCNTWQILREAVVKHSLSLFVNGHNEEDITNLNDNHAILYKRMINNVQYIFEKVIVMHFDANDFEFVRIVLWQFWNCVRFPIDCEE